MGLKGLNNKSVTIKITHANLIQREDTKPYKATGTMNTNEKVNILNTDQ